MLNCARAAGLERDGVYAHLFDESHFFDDLKARAMLQTAQGSLILDTKEWKE